MVVLWVGWQVIRPYVATRDFFARRRHVHSGDMHPIDQEFVDLLDAESGDDAWTLLESWLAASAPQTR